MSLDKSKQIGLLKDKVMELRKESFNKLLKAYNLSEDSEDVKILHKNGDSYIVLFGSIVWKEVLILNPEQLEYKLELVENIINDT